MPPLHSSTNPTVRSVFPFVVFFLAAIYTGFLEKVPFLSHLHVLTLVGGLALIAVAVGGRLSVVIRNPISKSLVLFTAWLVLCIPFAVWRGGSADLFINVWSKSVLTFLLVAGCILTIDQCKTVFATIGYSVGILAIMTLALRGQDKSGRLGLVGTRYENANDFAWTLILGLSFLGFLLQHGSRWQRFMALFLSVPILLALVKTGSRGGMVGLGMLAIFAFLQGSRRVKIRLALAIPLAVALLVAVAPQQILSRYTTLFGTGINADTAQTLSTEERNLLVAAAASAEQRLQILKDSISMTMAHPLFGVGPNNFPVAQNDLAIARGQERGGWVVTHNTYTQISSEMGIPGLVLYLVFLYRCFKPLNSIVRTRHPGRTWQELHGLAKSLRASLVVLLTIALFDSYGYDPNILILAGLSCALTLIAQRHHALLIASPQVPPAGLTPEPALNAARMSFQ